MSKKPDIRKCRELIKNCAIRNPTDLRYRFAGYVLAEHPIRVSEIPAYLRPLWEHGKSAGISLGHHAPRHRDENHDDDPILRNAMRQQLEAFAQKAGRTFKQDMRVA